MPSVLTRATVNKMEITVERHEQGDNSTLGRLYINGEFECFTLEDERRTVKVPGETAIPSGTYTILPRAEGGMHPKYAARYGDLHVGMAWLQDVPDFNFVYIHTGNREDQTEGCILVGQGFQPAHKGVNNYIVTGSRNAYVPLYTQIAEAWERNEEVVIAITYDVPSPPGADDDGG